MAVNVTTSPLQLKQLVFTKVLVEAIDGGERAEELWAPTFDFTGVLIANDVMVASREGQEKDPRDFMLALKLMISNADEDSKPAPYTVDVDAQALFELAPVFEVAKRESIVMVNGASMVVGAIREMLCQLTARSAYGPMTLPTLRFIPPEMDDASGGQ